MVVGSISPGCTGAIADVGRRQTAVCFLCISLATLFLPITALAADQDNSTDTLANSGGLPPSFPQTPPEQSSGPPRWTASIEAIVLERFGSGVNQSLVARLPGTVPFLKPPYDTATAPSVEAFNASQFPQVFSAGPKIGLTYHGESGYGAELSYLNILKQSATKIVGPDSPPDWLVMKAPGIFWQTQDFPYQGMTWSDTTDLYSAEANGQFNLPSHVSLVAGVRWLQLNDYLLGTLTPADRTAPTWKQSNPGDNVFQVTTGTSPAGNYPPFWNTGTTNNLYGAQIGMEGTIFKSGGWSLDGLIKIGLFDNNARQSTGVSLQKQVYPSTASTNHATFVSEAGVQLKYQLTRGLALKAGYEALWLDGVALATGQIQETVTLANVRTRGVMSTQSENVPTFCKMRMSPFALRRRGAGLHPAAAWERILAALEWLERFVTIKSLFAFCFC